MKKYLFWFLLIVWSVITGAFLLRAPLQQAGDIAEYYGVSQSILNHFSVGLRQTDQQQLEQVLHPAYFQDPGYYLVGRDNQRYPVHFVLYSYLLVPFRLLLRFFGQNELYAMSLLNLASVSLGLAVIARFWLKKNWQRILLAMFVFISPLMFFLSWPGPDLLVVMSIMAGLFAFRKKRYFLASLITAFASWQSQPVIIISGFFFTFAFFQNLRIDTTEKTLHFSMNYRTLLRFLLWLGILFIPYFYNLWAFGVLTPWTILQNGWTQITGFGLQNASLQRLYEQFFDLNIGLFWYAPLIMVFGLLTGLLAVIKEKRNVLLLLALLFTAIFFQTNPAWHFGTAGYGPTRHVIFAIPFFIYWIVQIIKKNWLGKGILLVCIVTQIFVLSLNAYYLPNFENTLQLSPVAKFVLTRWPTIYHPTPEIFVDRVNHSDGGVITSAVYKDENGKCVKAYVLKTDKEKIEQICGQFSEKNSQLLEDEFLRKANYDRTVFTTEATFWPDSESCEDWYQVDEIHPFHCMKTLQDVLVMTKISDLSRIKPLEYTGVWRLETGLPEKVTVPAGYIIQYSALDGSYVDF